MNSKQLIEYRDRILRTPKHLREFEEQCALNGGLDHQIEMALAEERRRADAAALIAHETEVFKALIATAEAGHKHLVPAVGDLYLYLTSRR